MGLSRDEDSPIFIRFTLQPAGREDKSPVPPADHYPYSSAVRGFHECKGKAPLAAAAQTWLPAEFVERIDAATGEPTVSSEEEYYLRLRNDRETLRWTEIALPDPGGGFPEAARAFLTAIGELHRSAAASGSAGGATGYQILGAEIYDVIPGDESRFAFLAQMRFQPINFPNAYWMAGGGVTENGDGTVDWETQIALVRGPDGFWRVSDSGWNVRAGRSSFDEPLR